MRRLFGFNTKKTERKVEKKYLKNMAKYIFSQNSILAIAQSKKNKKNISNLALRTFHWPSLYAALGGEIKTKNKKNVKSVDCVYIERKETKSKQSKAPLKKKSKKKDNATKSVKLGENVTDQFDEMEASVGQNDVKIKSTPSKSKTARKRKPKTIKASIPAKKANWKNLASAFSNPIQLSDYTKWLNNVELNEEIQPKPQKTQPIKKQSNKKHRKKELKHKINKSVEINEAIISEPLANLLFEQGHYEEAISMYEKLSLIFPEKSTLFADKIKALKK